MHNVWFEFSSAGKRRLDKINEILDSNARGLRNQGDFSSLSVSCSARNACRSIMPEIRGNGLFLHHGIESTQNFDRDREHIVCSFSIWILRFLGISDLNYYIDIYCQRQGYLLHNLLINKSSHAIVQFI